MEGAVKKIEPLKPSFRNNQLRVCAYFLHSDKTIIRKAETNPS
ncbi:hypothetical protein DOT_1849 [Desulfosporosinus sp. OT]|nr:hypothetical protein DOT_1849 [Desulfosporosinus sp. OT]